MRSVASSSELERVAACPICAAEEHEPMFAATEWQYGIGGEFPLARCKRCGSAYLTIRPTGRAIASYYPGTYYAYGPPVRHRLFARRDLVARAWYFAKRSILSGRHGYRHLGGNVALGRVLGLSKAVEGAATFTLGILLPRFVNGGSLLEVGCGSGTYLDLMRSLGWARVSGVDTSAGAIENVRGRLGIEAHCGSLENVGLPPASVDVLCASHTLEHVHAPTRFLAEAHRILKPGGRMILVVPNLGSLGSRTYGAAWYHLDAPRHLTHFTCSSLKFAVERAQFRVDLLATSARTAAWTALFSLHRARGEAGGFWRPGYRASPSDRLRAAAFSLRERALVAAGQSAGEEINLIAERAR